MMKLLAALCGCLLWTVGAAKRAPAEATNRSRGRNLVLSGFASLAGTSNAFRSHGFRSSSREGVCVNRVRDASSLFSTPSRKPLVIGAVMSVKDSISGSEGSSSSKPWKISRSCFGPALLAATSYRGGGTVAPKDTRLGSKGELPPRILLDKIEDIVGDAGRAMGMIILPAFHALRLGFGLSLLFYGMAFRAFAFHVIVFRLAGWRQVKRAAAQVNNRYREARKGIREAAAAAEDVSERIVKGDSLKEKREKMIREKERLLADGYLSESETKYFMRKYKDELQTILEEQDRFKSARSSVLSLRSSVNPTSLQQSVGSLYGALVTSFTASTIQAAGQVTLGLHIGSLLKTHILDALGPILDPIGYRLDLNRYYEKEDIPYMGKANAMGGPANMLMNIICYSSVFAVFRVHAFLAIKASMIYYGARVVTDYVIAGTEPIRRRLGIMPINHTPYSALIHMTLTVAGFYFHRDALSTAGVKGVHPLATGPGLVGLVEPLVRVAVRVSDALRKFDATSVNFIYDPAKVAKDLARRATK